MDTLKIKKDFEWVIEVLKSCKKVSQIGTSTNLLENFLTKWSRYISDVEKLNYYRKFRQEKNIVIDNILDIEN